MRRRDFLKGIAAFCGAAALPVAAKAITATRSEAFEVFDDTFVLQATADDNALRELRRLIHEARKRSRLTCTCLIDTELYVRIYRRLNAMERCVVGQPSRSFERAYASRPFFIDGMEVVADETMNTWPGEGHVVHFLEMPPDNNGSLRLYYASWYETITPATLAARRG